MADMNTAQRRQAAARGQALPDAQTGGRFPITDRVSLDKAIRAVGRVRPDTDAARASVRRFIIKRASALGASDMIPDSWLSDGSLKS